MKTNQIDKLYSKLTPKEQACLVLEATANLDEAEADAVIAAVERKQYLCLHVEYTTHIQKLQTLVGMYGTEYWKNRALILAACNLDEESGSKYAADAVNRFYDKSIALEVAMEKACDSLGVSSCAIKSMIGAIPGDVSIKDISNSDQELVDMYVHSLVLKTSLRK